MRRRFLVPVIALALPMLFAPSVAAVSVQPPDVVGQTVGWNTLWVPSNVAAETFTTPNKVERLDYVEVFFHAIGSGATVEAWVHAGGPSTSAIAGTDVTAAVNVGTGQNAWTTLVPPTSIILAANTQYSLMFRVTDGTNTTSFGGESDATSYSGGAAYAYDGSSWSTPGPNGTQDLSFQVFMSPLPGDLAQQQNVHETAVPGGALGQTFTATSTGTLTAVSLWSHGAASLTSVTVELCTVSTGIDCAGPVPSVVKPALDPGVLATSSVSVPGAATQWFNFVFGSPPTVAAGTQYAIVVLGNAGWSGSAANTYGSGAALQSNGSSWSAIGGNPVNDLAFQTFILGNGQTLPPTSSAGAGQRSNSGDSLPIPLLLALMAALPAVAVTLMKRTVVRNAR